jgi:hypothetical protein
MSKPAITSMIMYGDSGLELDVSYIIARRSISFPSKYSLPISGSFFVYILNQS